MTAPADYAAEALRCVRLALRHELAGTELYEDLLPGVTSYLAYMAAGLLSDLAFTSGDEAEKLLDIIETEALARAAR